MVISSFRLDFSCFVWYNMQDSPCTCQYRRQVNYCCTENALLSQDVASFLRKIMDFEKPTTLRRCEVSWARCHPHEAYGTVRVIGVDLDRDPMWYNLPGEDWADDWDASW